MFFAKFSTAKCNFSLKSLLIRIFCRNFATTEPATPLPNAHQGGAFCIYTLWHTRNFQYQLPIR